MYQYSINVSQVRPFTSYHHSNVHDILWKYIYITLARHLAISMPTMVHWDASNEPNRWCRLSLRSKYGPDNTNRVWIKASLSSVWDPNSQNNTRSQCRWSCTCRRWNRLSCCRQDKLRDNHTQNRRRYDALSTTKLNQPHDHWLHLACDWCNLSSSKQVVWSSI